MFVSFFLSFDKLVAQTYIKGAYIEEEDRLVDTKE